MGIYISVAFIYLFLGRLVCANRHKKGFSIFLFFLTFLMFALRSVHVGLDTSVYWSFYNTCQRTPWSKLLDFRFEIGFSVFCKFLTMISSNPQLLLAASGVLICGSISLFLYKYSDDIALSGYLWIFLCICDALNIMRGYLAFSILLFAIDALIQGKKKKFVIFVCLAMTFHTVAIVGFLLAFLPSTPVDNYGKKLLKSIPALVICFAGYSGILKIVELVFPQYLFYKTSVWGESNYFGAFLNVLVYGMLWIVGTLYLRPGRERVIYQKEKMVLFYCMELAFLFSLLTIQMKIFNRVSVLFTPMSIVWAPLFVREITDVRTKHLVRLAIEVGALAVFLTVAIVRPEWSGAIPYQFMWN